MNLNFDYIMDYYNFSHFRNYSSKSGEFLNYLRSEYLKTVVPNLRK